MPPNNLEQNSFYQRQIIMPEIGIDGQAYLASGSALVIGAGGLGSPLLFALAGAGVGRIGIVDADRVSASNLNRQFLYTPSDIDLLKAEQARKRLLAYHPDLLVEAFAERIDFERSLTLFPAYDLIIGAVDNNRTRRIINAACCRLKKTWIDGGVSGFSGYAAQIIPGKTPCLDCLFGFSGLPLPQAESLEDPSSRPLTADSGNHTASPGVIGATAGVIGSLEAVLAIQYLLRLPSPIDGEIIYYHGKHMSTSRIRVERTPDCPICGNLF